jgi:hypothetical protein
LALAQQEAQKRQSFGRSQWVGIEGSPQTQSFSAHAPLKNKNVGLGLSIINDKIGPSDELYMNGNFSLPTNRFRL